MIQKRQVCYYLIELYLHLKKSFLHFLLQLREIVNHSSQNTRLLNSPCLSVWNVRSKEQASAAAAEKNWVSSQALFSLVIVAFLVAGLSRCWTARSMLLLKHGFDGQPKWRAAAITIIIGQPGYNMAAREVVLVVSECNVVFCYSKMRVREKSKLSKPSKPSKPHTLTWYLHNKVPNYPSWNNHQT